MREEIFVIDSADLRRAGGGSTIRLIPASQANGVPGSTVGAGVPAIGAVILSVNDTNGLDIPLYPGRFFRMSLQEISEEEAVVSMPKESAPQTQQQGISSILNPTP
jgi:hypothetical protein